MVDIVSTAWSAIELIYDLGAEALRLSIINSTIDADSTIGSGSGSNYHVNKNKLENIKSQFMTEIEMLSSSIDALLYKDLYAAVIEVNSAISATYCQEHTRAKSLYEEVRKHAVMAYNIVPTFDKKILAIRLRLLGVLGYYYQELYCQDKLDISKKTSATEMKHILSYILSEVDTSFHMLFNEGIVKRALEEQHVTVGLQLLPSYTKDADAEIVSKSKKSSFFSIFKLNKDKNRTKDTYSKQTKTALTNVIVNTLSRQYDETQAKGYMSSDAVLHELSSLLDFVEHRFGKRPIIPQNVLQCVVSPPMDKNCTRTLEPKDPNLNFELFTAPCAHLPLSSNSCKYVDVIPPASGSGSIPGDSISSVTAVSSVNGCCLLYVSSVNHSLKILKYVSPNYLAISSIGCNSSNNNDRCMGGEHGYTLIESLCFPSAITCSVEIHGTLYVGTMHGCIYGVSNCKGDNVDRSCGKSQQESQTVCNSIAIAHQRMPVRCMAHATWFENKAVDDIKGKVAVHVLLTAGADKSITVWDISRTVSRTNQLQLFYQQLRYHPEVHGRSQCNEGNKSMQCDVSSMKVVYHQGEAYLFVGCYDVHTVHVWNIRTGACCTSPNSSLAKYFERYVQSNSGHTAGISAMWVHSSTESGVSGLVSDFLPSVLYTGAYDGSVCCWDLDVIFDVLTNVAAKPVQSTLIPCDALLHKISLQDTAPYIDCDAFDETPLIHCILRHGSRVYIGRDDNHILVYHTDTVGKNRTEWSNSVRLVGVMATPGGVCTLNAMDGRLLCGLWDGSMCSYYL